MHDLTMYFPKFHKISTSFKIIKLKENIFFLNFSKLKKIHKISKLSKISYNISKFSNNFKMIKFSKSSKF